MAAQACRGAEIVTLEIWDNFVEIQNFVEIPVAHFDRATTTYI
jgi:hypothetical protein